MRQDRFREAAKEGRTLLNAWLTLNSPFLIELIGEAGWDCLTIDQQHGLGGNDVLLQCLTDSGRSMLGTSKVQSGPRAPSRERHATGRAACCRA